MSWIVPWGQSGWDSEGPVDLVDDIESNKICEADGQGFSTWEVTKLNLHDILSVFKLFSVGDSVSNSLVSDEFSLSLVLFLDLSLNLSVLENGLNLGEDHVFIDREVVLNVNWHSLLISVSLAEGNVSETTINGDVVFDVLEWNGGVVVKQDAWASVVWISDPSSWSNVGCVSANHNIFVRVSL